MTVRSECLDVAPLLYCLTVWPMEGMEGERLTQQWNEKAEEMRGCNYPEGKVKTFGRDFVISFISASRTNRAVFCEIVLERLHRPL